MRFLRVVLRFETFSSKQDQVALYLGLGRGAEESFGAISGFRGGYHVRAHGAFPHLWSRYGPLLLILT
jgi:hypothetical protein